MKKADSSRLETLEALIAEKRRQETFLAKLEERRAGTPEQVFNRLRDEYLTKLTDAQVRAAAEAELLFGGLEDDDAALADVDARLATLEEERIETQLRAEVEEWDPKETQKKLTAMSAAIAMAEKERDARRSVAERTRALLTEAKGGTPVAGQSSVRAPDAPASGPRMRPTTATLTGGPNFDELAFLNSVVGRASTPAMPAPAVEQPSAPVIPPSPAPPPPPAIQPRPAQPSLELETPAPVVAPVSTPEAEPAQAPAPAPAAVEPPAPPAAPAAAVPEPASAEPPAAEPAEPASATSESAAPGAASAATPAATPALDGEEPSSPSLLGRPTPRTTQQVKTLKCAECGSMNYPTEWYCERCGGELAAL